MFQPKSTFRTEAAYQSFYPSQRLSPFVFEYWIMHLDSKATHDKSELELPEIYPEVIFKFGVDYEEKYLDTQVDRVHAQSNLCGVSNYAKASKRTNTEEELLLVGVKFNPLGMYTLTNMPLIELYNQCVPLSDLSIPFFNQLEEKFSPIKNTEELIEVLNQEFLKVFFKADIATSQLDFYHKINGLSFNELNRVSHQKHLHYKYLERNFKKYIGITPKRLSRLLRFRAFYKDWISAAQYQYIDLVYKHNFYDQNHLIKEFKSVLNTSPGKFLKSMDHQFTQHII